MPFKNLFSFAFIHHNFSQPIGMHATYLSMYITLSIVSFLSFLVSEKKKITRILYLISILILLIGLLQLTSKSVLIALIVSIIVVFPLLLLDGLKKARFIIIALIVTLVALWSITQIDAFKKRYAVELKEELTETSVQNEAWQPRIVRWHVALQLINQSPIIGYGSGSEKRLLKDKYFENKLYNSYVHELNAHNQFLSFLIKFGVLGLLVFLCTLYVGFTTAWQNKDLIFMSFMILITTVSFSENILDVNKGIFFYAFFFSFFIKSGKSFKPYSD